MKQIKLILLLIFFSISNVFAENDDDFQKWKTKFKTLALANNISEKTFDTVMNDTKFLANVIKYDRYQPEFYENTFTYIKKRSSNRKIKDGLKLYENEKNIEKYFPLIFSVEKVDSKLLPKSF